MFCNTDWVSVEQSQRANLIQEINTYPSEKLLNTATDDLASYFEEKFRLAVPALQKDQITVDQKEIELDVSQDRERAFLDRSRPFYVKGTCVEVEVPFLGEESFFRVKPTTYSMNPPRATIRQDKLIIKKQGTDLDSQKLKEDLDNELSSIETYLENLRQSAEQFNNSILTMARVQIESRKKKLLQDKNLVANLGFPLKQRLGTEHTYTAPEIKRKITPIPPKASSEPYQPEPILDEKEYQHILSIMQHMVKVMECSPGAFCHLGEEDLRTHFLVQLNGHYEGQASGETFNYEGKTDILIKSEGRNIFIAECKIWKGSKNHEETIEQLLGYLSWRDTKAAIVIFNRNKNFSNVLKELEETTPKHTNCKKLLNKNSETSWTYLFAQKDDPNRELTITVLAFDVPKP